MSGAPEMCRRISFGWLVLGCLLGPMGVSADTAPLWEAGAGAGGLRLPDYRGSDQTRSYWLPIPYLVYRGEFLRADRYGVRGVLLDSERFNLNLSTGASLPVGSGNQARAGMPELRATVELGPSLETRLWQTADRAARVDLRVPVRRGTTIERSTQDAGWVASPHLNLDIAGLAGLRDSNLGVLGGPLYGSRQNHRYFYAVAPEYVTASRAAYDPPAGHAGTQWLVAFSARLSDFWVGAFYRQDRLGQAVFEDSPLIRSRRYTAMGLGLSRVFGKSTRSVELPR